MKKLFLILSFFISLTSYGQIGNLTGNTVRALKNMVVPQDTITPPQYIGEIRTKVSGADTLFFISVAVIGDKKWYIYPKSGGGGPSSPTMVKDSLSYINLAKFGGGPLVDNGALIISLIAQGYKSIYIPAGTYPTSTKIFKTDSLFLFGDGFRTRFVITTPDTIIKVGRFSTISNIAFVGNGNASQVGISLDSTRNSKVQGCYFYSLGNGIYGKANGLEANDYIYGNNILNCFGFGNKRGIFLDTRAEYYRIEQCNFSRGDSGIVNYAGNNNIVNCSFNYNVVGGRFFGGANNAHSAVVATQFNHNTSKNILVDAVTLGLDFSSVQAFAGSLDVISSTRVTFTNLQMDVSSLDSIRWLNNSGGFFSMSNGSLPPSGNWVIAGTAPPIYVWGSSVITGGFSIQQGGATSSFILRESSGVVNYTGTNITRHNFGQTIVSANGTYNANRDANFGAIDVRYGGAVTYPDLIQASATGANVTAIFGSINTAGGYAFRSYKNGNVWFGGLTATNTAPTASIHIVAGTAAAGTAPLKFTAGTILTTAESGVLETDGGNNIFYTNATAVRGRLQQNRTLTSAAGTLSVTDNYNHYVFTGSVSTWTLPAVSGTANVIYYIKNRGSGVLTINTTSGNEIYDSAAVATINVSAGAALVLFSDGTYYNVE